MADAIDAFARENRVRAVSLDGPQGWRDPATPVAEKGVGRRCEYACRTQGKTGVYPKTYPGNQRPWIELCVAVFDALLSKPGVVLADGGLLHVPEAGYAVAECFPTSTWRASGLLPLPAKRKKPKLAPFIDALSAAYDLPPFDTSSHDDLQAVVAALSAMGLAGGPVQALPRGVISGMGTDGTGAARRSEGLIWDAAPLRVPNNQQTVARASSPTTPTAGSATVCVTSSVLAQVNRTDSPSQMQISLRGVPGGAKRARNRPTDRRRRGVPPRCWRQPRGVAQPPDRANGRRIRGPLRHPRGLP